MEKKLLYICNKEQCEDCGLNGMCNHTFDKNFALNKGRKRLFKKEGVCGEFALYVEVDYPIEDMIVERIEID